MKNRIILFLIDGCRPDSLMLANTKNIDNLIEKGSYIEGKTVFPSVTLPCHASLIFSVPPERHGITINTWVPPVRPIKGLFDVIHDAGYSTSFFYSWGELRDLAGPKSLDVSFYINHYTNKGCESIIGNAAAQYISPDPHDFNFIYFGNTDEAGHDYGFDNTKEYIREIEKVDKVIGKIVDIFNTSDNSKNNIFIITADHGGHERSHGTRMNLDMTIPLIICGKNIKKTNHNTFNIMDIAPTITKFLEIKPPKEWSGTSLF